VTPQSLTLPVSGFPKPTMVITLKIPSWKKMLSSVPAKLEDDSYIENSGMLTSNDSNNASHALKTLAHAATVVEAVSPASFELATQTNQHISTANKPKDSTLEHDVKLEPMSPDSIAPSNADYQHALERSHLNNKREVHDALYNSLEAGGIPQEERKPTN
jgi:hypothetical protein